MAKRERVHEPSGEKSRDHYRRRPRYRARDRGAVLRRGRIPRHRRYRRRGVERTASEIADKGGRVVGQKCDVSDAASCEAAVKRAVDEFGKLNILMNNAAYFIGQNTVEEVDIAEWRRAVDVNLTGPMLMSKYAIPAMRDAGGGSIIHVASQLGSVGKPMRSDYCAVKGGLIQLARCMAADHVGDNIRVNSLSPGPIGTERIFERSGSKEAAQRDRAH